MRKIIDNIGWIALVIVVVVFVFLMAYTYPPSPYEVDQKVVDGYLYTDVVKGFIVVKSFSVSIDKVMIYPELKQTEKRKAEEWLEKFKQIDTDE